MLVILKMAGQPGQPIIDMYGNTPKVAPEISGWILATDIDDARRSAEAAGEHELARALYNYPYPGPAAGRHELSLGWVGEHRYVMLVGG